MAAEKSKHKMSTDIKSTYPMEPNPHSHEHFSLFRSNLLGLYYNTQALQSVMLSTLHSAQQHTLKEECIMCITSRV